MFVFVFAYSIVASIILAVVPTSGVGKLLGVPWCFGSFNQPQYHSDLQWALLYPVLFIGALLTIIFIGASIVRLIFEGAQSSMKNGMLFKFFLVMTIFCIYFLVADAALLVFTFDSWAATSQVKQDIAQWYSCLLSWVLPTFDCPRTEAFNFGLAMWETVTFPLAGSILFICYFVLRERTWRCWQQLFFNLKEGRQPFEGITGTSSRTRTSASADSNSGSHSNA